MRKLQESELFSKYLSQSEKSAIFSAINTQLRYNVGIIKPENIELEVLELKKRAKKSYVPLVGEALSMYEANGHRIRLFNLSNNGKSPVPVYVPFLPDMGRNFAANEAEGEDANLPVVFMNMYRIGRWSADNSSYIDLRATSDLYSCLESGLFAYKLICMRNEDVIFRNKNVLENLTRIYTSLFLGAIIKTRSNIDGDVLKDAVRFIIAKFFLKYVLKMQESDTLDSYAYLSITNKTSMVVLKNQEEISNIDYDSLSGFLKSLGETFFRDPITLVQFITNWVKMYGEGMLLTIEYAPYLLHFLFAPLHGAALGGTCRLGMRLTQLQDDGLNKLYTAMINALR